MEEEREIGEWVVRVKGSVKVEQETEEGFGGG